MLKNPFPLFLQWKRKVLSTVISISLGFQCLRDQTRYWLHKWQYTRQSERSKGGEGGVLLVPLQFWISQSNRLEYLFKIKRDTSSSAHTLLWRRGIQSAINSTVIVFCCVPSTSDTELSSLIDEWFGIRKRGLKSPLQLWKSFYLRKILPGREREKSG